MPNQVAANPLPQSYYPGVPVIYGIMNRSNWKIYVGSAVNLQKRMRTHRHELRTGIHHSRYLQRSFRKTPDNLYVEVIEEIPNATKDQLIEKEQKWIDFYKSSDSRFGYNMSPRAHSCLGMKHTEETKIRMAKAGLGRRHTLESRQRMSVAQKLAKSKVPPMTIEQRKAWSDARKGRKHTEEEKANIRKWAIENTTSKATPVSQFTTEGVFVKKFRSISDAARASKATVENISQVCRHSIRRIAGGFMWRYSEEASECGIAPVRASRRGMPRVKLVECICNNCGKTYEVYPHKIPRTKYCSARCRNSAACKIRNSKCHRQSQHGTGQLRLVLV